MSEDDEFKDRDAQGLQIRKNDGQDRSAEAKARQMYMGMFFQKIPVIQLVLATATYLVLSMVLGMKELLDTKIAFATKYDLGYVYLAVYIICLGRFYIMANANAMRAGARVDRPDQHVYKLMDPQGSKDTPYVLMSNTGWTGKFNRAQRAAFNTDEALPIFLTNVLLAGLVFGPAILVPVVLSVYGRTKFAILYTEAASSRGAGFMPAMIGEQWTAGLVLFIALKAIGGAAIPF
eukprot:CAMPEP_0119309392 /NCGR_PEP_ID=MMETSP1333-20130426/15283_1 /TAXON_ID=418940 /ORGANISM="Scyphosphaera apsteinii, Strain RCC1455" /LENGTH=233 /DNA_ID=CAMNT_0007313353 /DNA_START=93 /DNA_END=794 /DNA_ORIENTATION=+